MPRIQPGPPCDVCGKPSLARKLCQKHYKRWQRHGATKQTRPRDWGKRDKHPLRHTWRWMSRTGGRVPEWDDFWQFVNDVGDRPTKQHKLRRYNASEPFGPRNVFWHETMPNKDRAARMRQYRQENPTKFRNYELKKRFGIGATEYDEILEKQNGKCAICGGEDDHFSLAVDHCHNKKHIRGLLCSKCNRGLGLFRDSPQLLKQAIEYLQQTDGT